MSKTLTFDLTKITAREIAPFLFGLARGRLGKLLELAPLVVKECPWGKADDPATYADMKLFSEQFAALYNGWKQAIQDAAPAITYASFALNEIEARSFDALLDHIQSQNTEEIARILATYTRACPEVTDVANTAAYLDLPYYTHFKPLALKLTEAGNDQLKKLLKL